MPYIVNCNRAISFTKEPVNKNTNNYIPNKQSSITKDPAPDVCRYHLHDLNSVYTHWDNELKRNVATPNILPTNGVDENKINNGGVINNDTED